MEPTGNELSENQYEKDEEMATDFHSTSSCKAPLDLPMRSQLFAWVCGEADWVHFWVRLSESFHTDQHSTCYLQMGPFQGVVE